MSKKGISKKNTEKSECVKQEPQAIFLNKSKNIAISILAKPGAKQNAITGISSEGVQVQINAPPTEGEANIELVKYISSVLGLKKSNVTLDKGFKSRNKTLVVSGTISLDEVKSKLINEIS